MIRRTKLIGWLAGCFLILTTSVVVAENRVAFVIGNANYATAGALANPINDASDVAIALEGLGFQVLLGTDLGQQAMLDKTKEFGDLAATSDVALFFYAGHGFQISGTNYLVPVDAAIGQPDDVARQTIPMQTILTEMNRAPGLKIIVLDACRDNPFGATIDPDQGGAEGLARVGTEADFLFAYSTQPDNVAYDGIGRNSFFTEAILNHIYTPGQDISELMINVRRDVLAATGGKQIPWNNSSLTRVFRFDRSPPTASEETLLWQVAANAQDPQLMNLYLTRYPNGTHKNDVEAFLGSSATRRPEFVTDSAAQADQLWTLARRTRMRPLIEFYLEQYPNGTNAADARQLLDTVPSPEDDSAGRICERLATHPNDATAVTAGVTIEALRQNAVAAVQACSIAVTQSEDLPHYRALLARAYAATNDLDRAFLLYQEAADQGVLRAKVSLAQLYERGEVVEKDEARAFSLYEDAAAGGNPDAQINVAVILLNAGGGEQDTQRAIQLLQAAAQGGSPQAMFNLGYLAENGLNDTTADALQYYERAARNGFANGYLAAAKLLNDGRIIAPDPQKSARLLMLGAAEDAGVIISSMKSGGADWTRETLTEMQRYLKQAGIYAYGIDGIAGPGFVSALEAWRNGGFDAAVLNS